MILYIVRHGIAVAHGTPGCTDDERVLTEEGAAKMRQAAAGMRNLGYIPGTIMSSPLPRASQTADILLEILGAKIPLKTVSSLAPSGTRQDLYREISQYEKKLESLMIVGHQPSLGEIAGEIAWGSADCYIELKKGGVCVLDLESTRGVPKGILVSLLTPSILRRLA